MKNICFVFNSKENTKRYPELLEVIKSAKLTKNDYEIFNSVMIKNEPINWNIYSILFIHYTDLQKYEEKFYVSIENFKGKIVYFSGGVYNFKEISDNEFSLNYTFLIKGLRKFLLTYNKTKEFDFSILKNIIINKTNYNAIIQSSQRHKKLDQLNYSKIINYLLENTGVKNILFVDDD
ncbi:MAG: hypothetical protein KAS62_00330, partial [Candidatus Delongbacteria bacterium]|nr:hypothetical protein [Candidatus Delongbacteria bacterium]